MAWPENVTVVRVTHAPVIGGQKPAGVVEVRPAGRVWDPDAGTSVLPKEWTVPVVDGAYTLEVPAVDDPQLTGADLTYLVTERFPGGSVRMRIAPTVAQAPGPVDLYETLVDAPVPGGTPAFIEQTIESLTGTFVALTDYQAKASEAAQAALRDDPTIRDAAVAEMTEAAAQTDALAAAFTANPTQISADGKKADTLAAAITAATARVTVPAATIVAIPDTLTVDKDGLVIGGTSLLRSGVTGSSMTAGPLMQVGTTTSLRSAIHVVAMRLASAKADALQIGYVKDSLFERLWINNATGSGIKTGLGDQQSWNNEFRNITTYANTVDGIDASAGAGNCSFRAFSAVSNQRYGLNACNQALIDWCTFDGNGVANVNIDGVKDVTIRDSYFEAKTGNYDPAAPKCHVRIVNAAHVRVAGRVLQVLPGTAIHIDNSSDVLLDELSSSFPINVGGSWEYAWANQDALGVYITASCRRIRLRNFTAVPIMFEDVASLDLSNRPRLSSTTDMLGGAGLFATDSNSDGLADGWTLTGTPTTTLVAASSAPNPRAQRIVTTADWQGIRHPVTLEPNATYTVVAFVRNDKDGFFGVSNTTTFNGGGAANLQALDRMRLVCVPFTTGASPHTNVGFFANAAGTTITVEGMRVLKGSYTVEDVPLI